MAYSVFLRPGAVRDLEGLPLRIRQRIEAAFGRLTGDPRPPQCRKLVGFENEWRLRVGDYRVLYVIDDPTQSVTVARVAHRREAYR